MKLVSKPCTICQDSILFQSEGSWCNKCQTPFHKKCIEQQNDICPKCQETFVAPEDPLNLKNKKWHEGVANYPKEYWLFLGIPAGAVTIIIFISAWYFMSKLAFGIFLIVMIGLTSVFEALITPLMWKFDDWFLEKLEGRKRKKVGNIL